MKTQKQLVSDFLDQSDGAVTRFVVIARAVQAISDHESDLLTLAEALNESIETIGNDVFPSNEFI